MSRTATGPTITEALAGAVLFGDISTDQARRALLCGLPDDLPCYGTAPDGVRAARQAVAEGRPTLLQLDTCSIPHKVGAFWTPQPFDAAKLLRAADLHPKGAQAAFQSGRRIRNNDKIGKLAAVVVEVDCGSKQSQADMLDMLEQRYGVRVAVVVDSGDVRPASLARARLREGVTVEPGKSLHLAIPIEAVSVGDRDYARAQAALCVILRGDLAARDAARFFRLPSVVAGAWGAKHPRAFCNGDRVRVQTTLRADLAPTVWRVADLADALEGAAADLGLDVAEGIKALEAAAAMRKAATPAEAGDAAKLLEVAQLVEALARITPEAQELLRTLPTLRKRKGKGARRGTATGSYGIDALPRDAMVRAIWQGVELERPFIEWGAMLAGADLGTHGEKGAQGIPAWAPTSAGLRHTTGDKAGTPRDAPSATLWCDAGAVRLACHVEGVVYVPSLPRDKAAELPAWPSSGASPWLQLPAELPPVVVLRSDTGTGKSHALCNLLRDRCALIVAPRVAIAAEAVRRYGAIDYRREEAAAGLHGDDQADQADLFAGRARVAVCVNSIAKIDLPAVEDGPFWLVLEESEQVAAALFGGTVPLLPEVGRAHAAKVLEALSAAARLAVASGGGVVCADAFAADQTQELLRAMLGELLREVVEVGVARARKIDVRFWCDQADGDDVATGARDAMRVALVNAARDGRRIMLACLTAREACAMGELLAATHKRDGELLRVKVYVGEDEMHLGSVARAPLRELADVNRAWGPEVCDVVIFSPVVSAAVSYDRTDDGAAFDIAALDAPRVPHADWSLCLQMLDRVRRPAAVWIYAADGADNVPEVADGDTYHARQLAEWVADQAASAAARGLDVVVREQADGELARLAGVCRYVADLRRADVAGELRRYFSARHAAVAEVEGVEGVERKADAPCTASEADKAAVKEIGELRSEARKVRRDARAELVCEAAPLNNAGDVKALTTPTKRRRLGPKLDATIARLESHRLRDRYGNDQITPELVEADRNGEVWRSVRELVRAGLLADGMTHAAAGGALRTVEAGCSAGARGDLHRTLAALLLLRRALGDAWLAGLLAPLRDADATLDGQGVAQLRTPLPTAGASDPLEARWSAATLDARSIADAFADDLQEHGIALQLLEGSGLHPGAVARDAVRAVGRALRRWGVETRSTRTRGDKLLRVYQVAGAAWQRLLSRAARRNDVKRGREVESAYALRAAADPQPASNKSRGSKLVDHSPSPVAAPLELASAWAAAAVEAARVGDAVALRCAVMVMVPREHAELWRIADRLPSAVGDQLREVLRC